MMVDGLPGSLFERPGTLGALEIPLLHFAAIQTVDINSVRKDLLNFLHNELEGGGERRGVTN